MPTLNSFIRTANASYKRAARANARYAREQAKRHQLQLKEQLKNENIRAVTSYNEFIKMLTSVHKNCSETYNWQHILQEEEPAKPINKKLNEQAALFASSYYKPSIIDKIFSLEKNKRKKLALSVENAIKADELQYHNAEKQYIEDLEDWKTIQKIAKGILAEDSIAYINALEFFNPFTNISELGSKTNCSFNNGFMTINIFVNSSDVIPDYILSYTSTGKLSNKKMPISKFNELYQDYICSCAIRVAREAFALLPINYTHVNAIADMLDSSNGRIYPQPILSCKFVAENMKRLNYESIDCSDAMRNFTHVMNFSKLNGFTPIILLEN